MQVTRMVGVQLTIFVALIVLDVADLKSTNSHKHGECPGQHPRTRSRF